MGQLDTYRPIGRWVSEVSGSYRGPKRFVYDADVNRVTADVRRRYRIRSAADSDRQIDTAARFHIYRMGPEHPDLVAAIGLDLCYDDKEA